MEDPSDGDANQSATAFSPKRRDVLAGTLGLGLTGAIGSSQATSSLAPTELSSVDSELADGVDRFTHDTTVTVDEEAHDFNTAPWDQEKVLSYNGYQYVPYWDSDYSLVLARRNLETGSVQKLTFSYKLSKPTDGHNNTALHMSAGDGRLHLAYDMHAQQMNYRHSEAGFLDDPPEELSADQFTETKGTLDDPQNSVTYPRFFTDASDELYFAYRIGGSGNGDTHLNSYDAETGTWTHVGMVISREGTYEPWNNSSSRNAYFHDIGFDDDNRLHITWTFRETYATYASNHDIHYAYSDDGGVTWKNNDGQQIADLEADDPIRIDDPGIVVREVPPYSWLINQGAQAIDAQNQPHIFTRRATEPVEDRREMNDHYIHYWRTPDGEWHDQYIDDPEIFLSDYGLGLPRRNLLFDDDNNLHIYTTVGGTAFGAYATAASGWRNWRIYPIVDDVEDLGKHDERRWEQDKVLSLPRITDDQRFLLEEFRPGEITPSPPALAVDDEFACPLIGPRVPLRWNGGAGAESYSVSRRSGGDDGWETVATGVGTKTFFQFYVDTDVEYGTAYEYRVSAVAGEETAASEPISVQPRAPAEPDWDWEADGETEGWQAGPADVDTSVEDGALRLAVDETKPEITSPCLEVDATGRDHLLLRMRSEISAGRARLFWRADREGWNSSRSQFIDISGIDDEYQTYLVDLSALSQWSGTVNSIRLVPIDNSFGTGEIAIDRIALGGADDFDVDTSTATPTETAETTATDTPTETTGSEASDPPTETPESTTVPGFGVGAAVVGIVGGTLAAIARRGDDDES